MAQKKEEYNDFLPQMPAQRVSSPILTRDSLGTDNQEPSNRLLPPIFSQRKNKVLNVPGDKSCTEIVQDKNLDSTEKEIQEEREIKTESTPPPDIHSSFILQNDKNGLININHEDKRPENILNTICSMQETKIPQLSDLPRKVKFNLLTNPLKIDKKVDNGNEFVTNKIRTARYNFFSFLPISLLIQYTKLGNVFWTIQTILQFSNKSIRT